MIVVCAEIKIVIMIIIMSFYCLSRLIVIWCDDEFPPLQRHLCNAFDHVSSDISLKKYLKSLQLWPSPAADILFRSKISTSLSTVHNCSFISPLFQAAFFVKWTRHFCFSSFRKLWKPFSVIVSSWIDDSSSSSSQSTIGRREEKTTMMTRGKKFN